MVYVDNSQITPLYANTASGTIADASVVDPAIAALVTAINTNADIYTAFITALELPIPDQSIVTRHLRNLAVTNSKLAALAVTADKIADGSITLAKLADMVITAAKIADGTITEPKYATGSVSSRVIANSSIQSQHFDPSLFVPYTDIGIRASFDKRGIDVTDARWGAKGDGITDDTAAIQSVVDFLFSSGGGTVVLPQGTYSVNTINLKTGVKIEGSSARGTKLISRSNNISIIKILGCTRFGIESLSFDGSGKTNVTAIDIDGNSGSNENLHGYLFNLWIDSVELGIKNNYSYFIKFDTVRITGTNYGMNLNSASNTITLINVSFFCNIRGLFIVNSTGISVTSCCFEYYSPIVIENGNGFSLIGNYFENTGGTTPAWLILGLANGTFNVTALTVEGNNFNVGADYAISIRAVNGCSIKGNVFNVTLYGIELYQYDDAPKHSLNVESNVPVNNGVYDSDKLFVRNGVATTQFSDNFNQEQVQPMLFYKQIEPKDHTLNNNQSVVYWNGYNLVLKKKGDTGTVSQNYLTGTVGASTIPGGSTTVTVPHNVGTTTKNVSITPAANVGNVWVDNITNNSFRINCSIAPASNTDVYWRVDF